VSWAVKLLLVLTLLPAHAPVCKVAAVEARADAPAAPAQPPCCKKCAKKSAAQPAPSSPKPVRPSKPICPPNSCPLCAAPSAVLLEAFDTAELDQPAAERLTVALTLLPPDGFHALLDRPPRA
jgi:hypothetical protein